jgi:thioredoxin reductase (NADPH)
MKILKFSLIIFFSILINAGESNNKIIDLVIIGSGPCGLCAAIYASRAKTNHVVITGQEEGGKLTKASYLENWPGVQSILGGELANDLKKQAEALGTTFIYDVVSEVDFNQYPYLIKLAKNNPIRAKSIVIGTGSKPNKLKCPGEDKYFGKGIAICAYCDAPLFQDKKVVVVGGGYAALREIGIIKKYTDNITVINKDDYLSGPKMLQNYVANDPSIKLLNNHVVLEIQGDGDKVTNIKIKNKSTNEIKTLPVDGVFISIGAKPNTKIFKDKLNLNEKKQIVVDTTRTSVKHVYAGGDVTNQSYHQAIMAAGEGYACAMNAEKDLCETVECIEKRKDSFAI